MAGGRDEWFRRPGDAARTGGTLELHGPANGGTPELRSLGFRASGYAGLDVAEDVVCRPANCDLILQSN